MPMIPCYYAAMKFILMIITLISSTSFAAVDYKKDCFIAQKYVDEPNPAARVNLNEWVKTQAEQMGFVTKAQGLDGFTVEVGTRPYILVVQGDLHNCEITGMMLKALQKLKDHQPPIEGMVFIFGKPVGLKNKIVLKEYNLTQEDVGRSNRLFADWVGLDKDPRKLLDIVALSKPLAKTIGKIKKDLKKIIDADEIKKLELDIQKVQYESGKWEIPQLISFKEKLVAMTEKKNIEILNSKVLDFENYVKLHDEVRRGLWDKANDTASKIITPSPKLKLAMEKGRSNIEGILKVIKGETENIEAEIKHTFKESKEVLSNVP